MDPSLPLPNGPAWRAARSSPTRVRAWTLSFVLALILANFAFVKLAVFHPSASERATHVKRQFLGSGIVGDGPGLVAPMISEEAQSHVQPGVSAVGLPPEPLEQQSMMSFGVSTGAINSMAEGPVTSAPIRPVASNMQSTAGSMVGSLLGDVDPAEALTPPQAPTVRPIKQTTTSRSVVGDATNRVGDIWSNEGTPLAPIQETPQVSAVATPSFSVSLLTALTPSRPTPNPSGLIGELTDEIASTLSGVSPNPNPIPDLPPLPMSPQETNVWSRTVPMLFSSLWSLETLETAPATASDFPGLDDILGADGDTDVDSAALLSGLSNVVDQIVDIDPDAAGNLTDAVLGALPDDSETMASVIPEVGDTIQSGKGAVLQTIIPALGDALDENISPVAPIDASDVPGALSNVVNRGKDIINQITNAMGPNIDPALQNVVEKVSGIVRSAEDQLQEPLCVVNQVVNGAIDPMISPCVSAGSDATTTIVQLLPTPNGPVSDLQVEESAGNAPHVTNSPSPSTDKSLQLPSQATSDESQGHISPPRPSDGREQTTGEQGFPGNGPFMSIPDDGASVPSHSPPSGDAPAIPMALPSSNQSPSSINPSKSDALSPESSSGHAPGLPQRPGISDPNSSQGIGDSDDSGPTPSSGGTPPTTQGPWSDIPSNPRPDRIDSTDQEQPFTDTPRASDEPATRNLGDQRPSAGSSEDPSSSDTPADNPRTPTPQEPPSSVVSGPRVSSQEGCQSCPHCLPESSDGLSFDSDLSPCESRGFRCGECLNGWFFPPRETPAQSAPCGLGWPCYHCSEGWFCVPDEDDSTAVTTPVIDDISDRDAFLGHDSVEEAGVATLGNREDDNPDGYYYSLGCFRDGTSRTLLGGIPVDYLSGVMSTSVCVNHCLERGYTFAGTENGHECWCGETMRPDAEKIPESDCQTPCHGNQGSACGGQWAISVFANQDELLRSIRPAYG